MILFGNYFGGNYFRALLALGPISPGAYPTPVPGFPSTPRRFLEAGLAEAAFAEAGIAECGARSAPLHLSGDAGPWDQGTMGPRGYGTKGPWDHRTMGPRDHGVHGPFGPMDPGPFGPRGGPFGPAGPFGPT